MAGEKKASFLLFLPPACMQQQAAGAESMPVLLCQVWHCQGSVLLGFSRGKKKKKEQGKEEVLMPAVFLGAPTAPLSSPTTTKPQQRFAGRADDALTAAAVALPCCWSVQKPCQQQLFSKNGYFLKCLLLSVVHLLLSSWFEKFCSPSWEAGPGEHRGS